MGGFFDICLIQEWHRSFFVGGGGDVEELESLGAQAHELLEALSDLLACPFFYDTILSEINLGQHAFIILNGLL